MTVSPPFSREGFHYKDGACSQGLPTDAAVGSSEMIADRYDVIVIGAGFAGLTAARDLSKAGKSVLLVEARDRIGGRTWSSVVDGHLYEIGGTWVHWSQPFVWAEICRYGHELTETAASSQPLETVYSITENGPGPIDAAAQYERLKKLMKLYMDVDGAEGRRIFPRGPDTFFNPDIAELDHLTMEGRLAQLDLPEADKDILRTRFNANPTEPERAGFLDLLRWWALCDYDVSPMTDRFNRYKIKDGMTGLALSLLRDSTADILLEAPVTHVTDQDGKVSVTTASGQVIEAGKVIVALPVNLLHSITFDPAPEPLKAEVYAEGLPSKNAKFHIHTQSAVGNIAARTIWPWPLVSFLTDAVEGDDTYVVGFTRGNMVDYSDPAAIIAEVQKFLPDLSVGQLLGHDWTKDPWSRGAHGMYGPGQLTRFLRALQRPAGNVHFAGSDISEGWRGYVDGAIQSGMETARKLISEA